MTSFVSDGCSELLSLIPLIYLLDDTICCCIDAIGEFIKAYPLIMLPQHIRNNIIVVVIQTILSVDVFFARFCSYDVFTSFLLQYDMIYPFSTSTLLLLWLATI